jgi:glycosyltransferase involved in cell wall biosynthesis
MNESRLGRQSNGSLGPFGPGLRPALVHDYLLVMRGAERTFAAMTGLLPDAPLYTLLYSETGTKGRFADRRVTTSYLQRLGVTQGGFRRLLPLLPRAAESLPLQEYDVVVSSSSAFAHGVRAAPDALHVCYCHSPFRYAWHERERALAEAPRRLRPVAKRILDRVKRWDISASQRVSRYVANSEITRERIRRFWGRDATILHPPVDVRRFRAGAAEDYLLVVTELVAHKRVDLALEAAELAGRPIKVVGAGPELERLSANYPQAEFLGRLSDDDLNDTYARALALVVPNVEEFGIAAVEAQAAGRPVLAAAAGGARETVIDGVTGVLVPPGDVSAMAEAMRATDFDRFCASTIHDNAQRFSIERFRQGLSRELAAAAGHTQGPASLVRC